MPSPSPPLYVYALVDVPIEVDMPGVMDEPLVVKPAAAGWLVIGELQPRTTATAIAPQATPETLRAQDQIIRAVAARADAVLPMRFGTCVENETALQNRMARFTADHLRTALQRVRGCEQMTLRLFQSSESPAPREARTSTTLASPRPGTAYLAQRAAALSSSLPELLEPPRRALADIVRDEIIDTTRRPPLIGSAYHLIPRGEAPRYLEALAIAVTPATVTIRATGPSPVYAFAKDALR
jgi:hypothetical protein